MTFSYLLNKFEGNVTMDYGLPIANSFRLVQQHICDSMSFLMNRLPSIKFTIELKKSGTLNISRCLG